MYMCNEVEIKSLTSLFVDGKRGTSTVNLILNVQVHLKSQTPWPRNLCVGVLYLPGMRK